MPTALAAVFEQPGQPLVMREFSVPALGPGEALVRVTCCTVCGSDLHTFRGDRETPVPTVLGHEIVGVVAALADDSPPADVEGVPLRIGERVVWSVAASCGQCFFCTHALPQKCTSLFKYGHERLTPGRELCGGLAEMCLLVRGAAVVRVPPELPDLVAAPGTCATATVAAALREGGDCAGEVVVIHGAGMLGLTACAMAHTRGARLVILTDPDADRLTRGGRFGAGVACAPSELDGVVRAHTEGRGADLHLELAGVPEAITQGLDVLRIGGRSVWVGAVRPMSAVAVSPERVVRRLLRIVGVHNYQPADLTTSIRFLADTHARMPFAELVEHVFPLHEANAALEQAAATSAPRVAVTPGL